MNTAQNWRGLLAGEYRLLHPDWTQARIGKEVGITTQGVSAALIKLDLPTRNSHWCGPRLCKYCLLPLKPSNERRYCDDFCRHMAHRVTILCPQCGKPKVITRRRLKDQKARYKTLCCSHRCSILLKLASGQFHPGPRKKVLE